MFPVKLPLFPILNASEQVQRLIEKDAEDARKVPKTDGAEAQPEQLVSYERAENASRLAPVGGVVASPESSGARAGGEIVSSDDGKPGAHSDTDIQRLDMRS